MRVSEGETGTETGCSCWSAVASSSGTCSSAGIRVSSSVDLRIVGLRDLVFLSVLKRLKETETFRNETVGEGMGIETELG